MRINPINNTAAMPNLSTKRNIQPRYGYISEPVNEPAQQDAVNFKGLFRKKINVDLRTAKFYAKELASSSSEKKAIFNGGSTLEDEVRLISLGIAGYVAAAAAKDSYRNGDRPVVLIGGDEGNATKRSINEAKNTLIKQGVDVLEVKDPVSTSMLALAAKEKNIDLAVLMTTSHNYWHGGEYNLITKDGAIAPQEVSQEVADNMEKIAGKGSYRQKLFGRGHNTEIDPYYAYRFKLMSNYINWNNIRNSGLKVYYDGLGGTGEHVVPKLLDSFKIPYVNVNSSAGKSEPRYGKSFKPNADNLQLLSKAVSEDTENNLRIGFSTDADAEGIGLIDEKGNFINSNDVLLLAAYNLAKNKGQKGVIIHSQAVSSQLDKFAEKQGLEKIETPIGFQYITKEILKLREKNRDVLVAGDEQGSFTIKNHVPVKDGIMAISLVMDLIAKEGKPISEILKDVKQNVGKYYETNYFSKYMGLSDNVQESINKIMAKAEGLYKSAVDLCEDDLGDDIHTIDNNKTEAAKLNIAKYKKEGDGVKLIMTDGSSILLRPDETELAINCYIDAAGKTPAAAKENVYELRMFMDDFLAEYVK